MHNAIFNKKLRTGYIIEITYFKNGPLSIVILNKDEEFLGSKFTTLKKLPNEYKIYTNGELELSNDELDKIQSKLIKVNPKLGKNESTASNFKSLRDVIDSNLERYITDK